MSESQATRINPGVFSAADSAGGDSQQDWSITITGGSNQTYSPTNLPTTLTPSSNFNRFDASVKTINLAATSVTTLAGPVLFGNDKIEKLVLPATATNWQLTEPNSYESAPIGGVGSGQKLQTIEWSGFKQGTTAGQAATSFETINWALVASIMNMFGRVEADKGKDTNLAIWSEGKWDRELTATTVKSGWTQGGQPLVNLNGSDGTWTREYNGVTWTYTKTSGTQITLTATTQDKKPNAYKAGYTGNANAFFQVGFGSQEGGKIDSEL